MSRTLWVVLLVLAVILGALLSRVWSGGSWIFSLLFILSGLGALIRALLLKLGKVAPGKLWGGTPLGQMLIGIGMIGLGISYFALQVLGGLGVLSFITGLLVQTFHHHRIQRLSR